MAERKELTVEETIELDSLPSNSHKSKERSTLDGPTKSDKVKIQKVVKGKVIQKKKPLGQRIASTIIGEDTRSVGSYLISDVLIPAAKDLISDMITGGIQMLLFGETSRNSSHSRNRNKTKISYSKYWDDDDDEYYHAKKRRRKSNSLDDDLIFNFKEDAEEILSYLEDMIDTYEVVSVADLYDMAGVTCDYTDQKWGWYNVQSGRVVRTRDGYVLKLPKPVALD